MGILKKSADKPRKPTTVLYEGNYPIIVVGTEYHDGIKKARPGRISVSLRREPTNPHDANAIAVYIGSTKLGYFSAFQAARYAPIIDQIWGKNARLSAKARCTTSRGEKDVHVQFWEYRQFATKYGVKIKK